MLFLKIKTLYKYLFLKRVFTWGRTNIQCYTPATTSNITLSHVMPNLLKYLDIINCIIERRYFSAR
jgi:hypothetical protein